MSAWYRTYRPQLLSQLHLQDVRSQLQKIFSSGHIPHALLFTGPRGAGKTSAARIVAATLNDPANVSVVEEHFLGTGVQSKKTKSEVKFVEPDPNNDITRRIFSGNSVAVHELDAASNRGIDDIRSLKERLALPPQEGKVSVYILDEVHMLTNEAFNALLKVLEEPPRHVMFILATTEFHKLPETIVSRCTVIQFRKAEAIELEAAVIQVLTKEGVNFESSAVLELAQSVDGSFRDAIKSAEYLVSQFGSLTAKDLLEQGGLGSQDVLALVRAIVSKSATGVVKIFQLWRQQHRQPQQLHQLLVQYLHQQLTNSVLATSQTKNLDPKVALYLLKQFQDKSITEQESLPFLGLELLCLEIIAKASEQKNGGGSNRSTSNSSTNKSEISKTATSSLEAQDVGVQQHKNPDIIEKKLSSPASAQALCDAWEAFVELVNKNHRTIGALLASAQPEVAGAEVQVNVFYSFHLEKFKQPIISTLLHELAQSCIQDSVGLQFVLGEKQIVTKVDTVTSDQLTESPTLESAVEAYLV